MIKIYVSVIIMHGVFIMILISTKGRYALQVMLDLAEQDSEKFVPLEEIASRQGISKKYLEAILKVLVQHGFLKGLSGRGGGYKLTRKPAEYNVGEILELTEVTLATVSCLKSENNTCEKKFNCRILPMWEKFNEITHEFFFNITLEDILNNKF